MASREVRLLPVAGIDEVVPGDDLATVILTALTGQGMALESGDVVVISSKIVAKASGAFARPEPGETLEEARRRLTRAHAAEVLAETPHVTIVRTHDGHVAANAGIDASNLTDAGSLLLLPVAPDRQAAELRLALQGAAGVEPVGLIVSDTFGRAWRVGQTDVAIGASGVPALRDERGGVDRQGRTLTVTAIALLDELAAAADLVRRKADGVPVVLVRGLTDELGGDDTAADLIRPVEEDLFAHGRGWLARRLALGDLRPAPATGQVRDQRGAPRTRADRSGPLTPDDVESLRAAADGLGHTATVDRPRTTLSIDDGPSAGLLLAAVLDLGYAARLEGPQRDGRWRIVLDDPTSIH